MKKLIFRSWLPNWGKNDGSNKTTKPTKKKFELSVKLGGGGEGEEFIAEIRNVILLDPK